MEPGEVTRKDPRIAVCTLEGQRLNGLGMMLQQYLEQNFSDFEDKVRQGLRIRGRVAVEVERGIGITIDFQGEKILIENGIQGRPDLYLKSSYLLLSKVLSGRANPYLELLRGNIKLLALARRPMQSFKVLQFLKIPPELLLEPVKSRRNRYILWALATVLGAIGLALLIYQLFRLPGG